jgi:F-type H+-transporting ATPase subunit delta
MKINNSQYASALYESAKGKSQSEIDELVANFVKILAKNNQIKNVKNILVKFKEIWNRKEGIVEAEVVSREKLNSGMKSEIEKYVEKKYKAEKVEIIEKVDPGIKGGIIVRVGDEVMDASISGQLKKLKSSLQK